MPLTLFFLRVPALALLSLLIFTSFVLADSHQRNPLRLLGDIARPVIHTTTHRVHAYSSFELTFDTFEGHRRISVLLEPNHDVIPEDAYINYLGPDGSVRHAEPIRRLDHKVYKGVARQARSDGTLVNVGWARFTVIRDGVHPIFEGGFSVNQDSHHVQTRSNYMRTKHDLDPIAEDADDEYMVVWRDSDVSSSPFGSFGATVVDRMDLKRDLTALNARSTCDSDLLEFNTNLEHPVYAELLKRKESHWGIMPVGSLYGKRQIDTQPSGGNQAGVNLVSTIGQTAGCPSTKRVALVGVATDCTYTGSFNSTQTTRDNIITQMNLASNIWERAFNISLGLQNLTVSDAVCPGTPQAATEWNQNCQANLQIQDRLNLFSAWRGTLVDDNSHWTLMSTCGTGSAVGLSWLGLACVRTAQTSNTTDGGSETVSGANVVIKTSNEWQVLAHENGHMYGAVHDCTSSTCDQANVVSSQQCCPLSAQNCDAQGQYIMNPSTAPDIQDFSPCSIGNICSAIGRNSVNTTCLSANKGVVTISGQQCGNGIVEQGEDCDCGGVDGCGDNSCCDATTCKFKNSAVCDDSNEDCCQNCQFAPAQTVCRASSGVCDPAEYCTGNTPSCPADQTAPDGQKCTLAGNETAGADVSQLRCASGQCTSRDLQCKTVMGAYTNGSNDTYACDSNTCTMSCASPAFGVGVCYGLQQNLLDGTPCGGNGHCSNGLCKGSSFGGQVKSWVDDHKNLVIGIACGVGALVLLAIMSCVWSCCRRRRTSHRPIKNSPNGSWYAGGPPVPAHGIPMQQQAAFGSPVGGQQHFEHYGGWQPPPPSQSPQPTQQPHLYGGGIIGNSHRGWGNGGWDGHQVPMPPPAMRYA